MSERRVNVRVQTVGGDAVKRELQDIGNTGKQGLAEIGEGDLGQRKAATTPRQNRRWSML